MLSALSPAPLAPAAPVQPANAAELAKRGQIRETAENFEASFLSAMLQEMFKEVQVSEPFGGGEGEDLFKSFMTDAFSKQIVKSGGVGLSDAVAREMLKLQGLE